MSYKTFIGTLLLAGFFVGGGSVAYVQAIEAPTVTLSANPSTLSGSEYTTLSWTSTNATSCTASGFSNGWSGPKTTQGAQPAVGPFNDTYTLQLTCVGAGGSKTASVVIRYGSSSTPGNPVNTPATPPVSCVNLPVTLTLGSQGADVTKLQTFLRAKGFLTANATGYFGTLTKNAVIAFQKENGLAQVGTVGPLTRAKIRLLTCGDGGTPTTPSNPSSPLGVPTVNLKINGSNGPITLTSGQTVVMSWESANATSCNVGAPINSAAALSSTGGAGATFGPDSPYYPRTSAITYTITCTNKAGTATDSVLVNPSSTTPTTPVPPTSGGLPVSLKVNGSDGSVSVPYGNPITLTWSAPSATTCTLGVFGSDAATQIATNGSITYTLSTSYYPGNGATFRIACSNATQSGNSSVALTMTGKPDAVSVDIKANGGDAPITVAAGNPVSITWNATPSNSAYMTCVGSGSGVGSSGIDASLWNGGKTFIGLMTARPIQTTTYTITCTAPNGSATDSVTVNVENNSVAAPKITFSAYPTTVMSGQATTLTWTTTDATNCIASNDWAGTRPTSGSTSTGGLIAPNYIYILQCSGPGGSASASVQINVAQSTGPAVTLIATPTTVVSGQSATLSWTSVNTTSCTASGSWSGTRSTSGSVSTGALTGNASYTITCTGSQGSAESTAVVSLSTTTPDPTVTISASPTSAAAGQTTNLTWSSTNATSCTASGSWSGSKTTSGTQVSAPLLAGSNIFIISCSNGTKIASATALVTGGNAPQVSTKFVVGSRVFVKSDVNARPNPSVSSTPASLHPSDDLGSVVDGPVTADGYTWWKIDYVTGVDGWTIEDNLGLGGISFTPVSKIFYFTASPTSIINGQATTLSWYANATNCGVFQNATDQFAIGGGYLPGVSSPTNPGVTSMTVSPASTWTYTLKCYKDFGSYTQGSPTVTQPLTVTVSDGPAPTISSFSISPSVITSGASTNLSWSASANSCKIFQETYQRGSNAAVSQVITSGNTSGTLSVSPKTLGTFTLVCERNRQTVSRSVAVTADLPGDPTHDTTPSQATVSMNLKVNGSTGVNNIVPVVQGNDVVISWDSQFSSSMPGGATTCHTSSGNPDLGSTMLSGSATLSKVHQFYPKADKMLNITMTCMGTDSTFKTFSATKDIMVKLLQQ